MPGKGRRGNGEGSLTKCPDGRWEARITLENGKRKSFFSRTRQAAARRLAEALRDQDKGLPIVGEKQTLRAYLAEWLAIIKPTLRESAWQRYEEICRLHIVPRLGGYQLSKLGAQHLNQLYAEKLAQGLSPRSVRYVHVTLHKALNDALRVGLVQRNVALVTTPPRKRRRTMEVFSSEQARIFLEAVRGDRLEALYVVAITCGMRQGELLSLRWRDTDLDAGHVQVRSSVRKRPGRFIFTDPKTEHGRRKVALTALAIQALLQHRARQQLEQLAAGPAWSDGDLVFCNELGQPLIGINVTRHQYVPILKRAGLPLIRFHDLRHTAATLLLLQGVHPKIVSEMLGHASITITLDLYSHVLPDMQKDATAAMDRLLRS
jgi:integrase